MARTHGSISRSALICVAFFTFLAGLGVAYYVRSRRPVRQGPPETQDEAVPKVPSESDAGSEDVAGKDLEGVGALRPAQDADTELIEGVGEEAPSHAEEDVTVDHVEPVEDLGVEKEDARDEPPVESLRVVQ